MKKSIILGVSLFICLSIWNVHKKTVSQIGSGIMSGDKIPFDLQTNIQPVIYKSLGDALPHVFLETF